MPSISWTPPEDPDPHDILHSAVDDTCKGAYRKALAKFEWFHGNALATQPSLGGVRCSFALSYWLDLATVYPPAREAFIRTRDDTEAAFRLDPGTWDFFFDLAAMNRCLDEGIRTADLFAFAADKDLGIAQRLYHVAEPYLIASGRFEACAPFLESEKRIKYAANCYRISKQMEESREGDGVRVPKFARKHFTDNIATLVGLLAINDRPEEAIKAYNTALQVIDDEEFRSLMDAAMTGHFPEK